MYIKNGQFQVVASNEQ